MQISRHWRLNAQRYRLEGFRNSNGQVSLQPRPFIYGTKQTDEIQDEDINKIDEKNKNEIKDGDKEQTDTARCNWPSPRCASILSIDPMTSSLSLTSVT